MKKFISIILFVFVILLTSSCAGENIDKGLENVKYDYTFTGENDNWEAEYIVTGEDIFIEKNDKTDLERQLNKILSVTYKNDISDLLNVKQLEISYASTAGGSNLNLSFPEDGVIEQNYTLESRTNGAVENKDEIIKVIITIDGEMQEIELKTLLSN